MSQVEGSDRFRAEDISGRITSGESYLVTRDSTIATKEYYRGLRFINDGLAISERLGRPEPRIDYLLSSVVDSELKIGNVDQAIKFVNHIHRPETRFSGFVRIAWNVIDDSSQADELLELVKETGREIPFLSYRAMSFIQIVRLEAKMGQDFHKSLYAAEMIANQLRNQVNRQNPREHNSEIATIFMSIAQTKAENGEDATSDFAAARQAAEDILNPFYRIQELLRVAEAEEIAGFDSFGTLKLIEFLLSSINEEKMPGGLLLWFTALKAKKGALEFPVRLQVISGFPYETEYGMHYLPQKGFGNDINMAIIQSRLGGNPLPYIDAAKEKVLLRTIRSNKTATNLQKIAEAELEIGAALLNRSVTVLRSMQIEDFVKLVFQSFLERDRELLSALGAILPVSVQEAWITVLPQEAQSEIREVLVKGRILQ